MSADTGSGSTPQERSWHRLGRFLRTVRARATPPVGAPPARRRVRGLRREEVAIRAGISVTWYTWLEQGRPVRPSPATLRSIASAMQMTAAETEHLLSLAPQSGESSPGLTSCADGALLLLVETLAPHPAYAVNGRWDVLATNRPARQVFGRFDARPGTSDNVLRRLFLDPRWRRGFADWEDLAASAVAQFRLATAPYTDDPGVGALVAGLLRESPEFVRLWNAHQVQGGASHEKSFAHHALGPLRFHYSALAPEGAPADARVIVYRAADARTARALAHRPRRASPSR